MLKKIPKGVWGLGFVSLFMDASSEMIHSLLPIFMLSELGANMAVIGAVEGVAEAAASVVKIFSGALSDYLGKRKGVTLFGYGIAALSKPFFPLSNSIAMVFWARFVDRVGKGIRGAPRDALIGEIAPQEIRGACFGLRQSLDTAGAVIGPLLGIGCMFYFSGNIRYSLWVAIIPAALSVMILYLFVREPEKRKIKLEKIPLRVREIKLLGERFWLLVFVGAMVALARFSEAFLILKAVEIGLSASFAPIVLVVMNITYFASSYPAGAFSDKIGRKAVLFTGVIMLILADVIIGISQGTLSFFLGVAVWGVHMGLTHGIFATMVSDRVEVTLRGTAYGFFNFVTGLLMIPGSILAGVLWDNFGSIYAFGASAVIASIAVGAFRKV